MDESALDALETVEFLAASPVRPQLVTALADGPTERRRLESRLEAPRSTLHRNLSELVDRGLVSRSAAADEYELTVTGEIVSESLAELLSVVERTESLRPFLEYFPAELPVDDDALADAEIVAAAADAPFDPISTVESILVDGDSVRGFLPVINPVYVDALRRSIENDVSGDVIAPPATYERLAETHSDAFAAISEAPSIRLYESTAVPNYGVGFVDETVLLGAFDDHMRTHSVLRADAETPIWDWAQERYADLEATARRLETDD